MNPIILSITITRFITNSFEILPHARERLINAVITEKLRILQLVFNCTIQFTCKLNEAFDLELMPKGGTIIEFEEQLEPTIKQFWTRVVMDALEDSGLKFS